jgi:transcriptional regulator with XRE-family HTH domain
MRIFSQRIKELRKENGYTQRELATKLELTNSTVCDWETGRSEPDLETLKKIAQLFSVSTDYLLGLSDI